MIWLGYDMILFKRLVSESGDNQPLSRDEFLSTLRVYERHVMFWDSVVTRISVDLPYILELADISPNVSIVEYVNPADAPQGEQNLFNQAPSIFPGMGRDNGWEHRMWEAAQSIPENYWVGVGRYLVPGTAENSLTRKGIPVYTIVHKNLRRLGVDDDDFKELLHWVWQKSIAAAKRQYFQQKVADLKKQNSTGIA